MPECVEVEKLRQRLNVSWMGRRIVHFKAPRSAINPRKYAQDGWAPFNMGVKNYIILNIQRVGKHLWIQLSDRHSWQIHLGGTGWFRPAVDALTVLEDSFIHSVSPKTIRVKLFFDDGQQWNYHDARTWGKWWIKPYADIKDDPYFQGYGPDWLDEEFKAKIALVRYASRRSVKDVLCDQRVTAGIGNYISCEVLHLAGIHPHKTYDKVSKEQRVVLAKHIELFLRLCIKNQDHSHWRVFLRRGKECLTCRGEEIEYEKDGGGSRGSYFCRKCQPG